MERLEAKARQVPQKQERREIAEPVRPRTPEPQVSTIACRPIGHESQVEQPRTPGTEHTTGIVDIVQQATALVAAFTAGGRLKYFSHQWCQLTHDTYILNLVNGYKIEFRDQPFQYRVLPEIRFSQVESQKLREELAKLLTKQIIVPCGHEPGEYISPIFLREKWDGRSRVILNLSKFHDFVEDQHFKMETLHTVLTLMKPGA